jgi:hypothetical protein
MLNKKDCLVKSKQSLVSYFKLKNYVFAGLITIPVFFPLEIGFGLLPFSDDSFFELVLLFFEFS